MKRHLLGIASLLMVLFFTAPLSAKELTLASGGKSCYSIVVDKNSPELTLAAADDLKLYLEKITGAKFSIDDSGKKHIYLGVAAPGDKKPMKPAERRIKSVDGNIYIYGENYDGAPFGVYDLLEKFIGCRWYTAWGDEFIPSKSDLTLPELDYSHTPGFQRYDTASLAGMGNEPKVRNFLRRMRIHIVPDRIKADDNYVLGFPLHTFCKYLPPGHIPQGKFISNIGWAYKYFTDKKYFKTNPEFFSLDANGNRIWNNQLCLSNKELRKEFTKNLEIVIANEYKGGDAVIAVDMNDKNGYLCYCPGCIDLLRKYETTGGPIYDYLIELGNYFLKKYPRIKIRSLAYQSTLPPPKEKMPPNVMLWYAPLRNRNILRNYKDTGDPTMLPDLKQLSRSCSTLSKWFYVTPFNNRTKVPPPMAANLWRITDDLQTLREHNVTVIMTEFGQGGVCSTTNFGELRLYLIAKAIDDPSRNPDDIIKEFLNGYYGSAADEMFKFLKELHDAGASSQDAFSSICYTPWQASYLTTERLIRWDRAFDRMEELTANAPRTRMHVRRARRNLDEMLLFRWEDLGKVDPAYSTEAFHQRKARYTEQLRETFEEVYTNWVNDTPASSEARLERTIARHLSHIEKAAPVRKKYTPVRPLPPELAALPQERVHRVPYLPANGSDAPADPDAAFGFAMPGKVYSQLRFQISSCLRMWGQPLQFTTIKDQELNKYHYYYLGEFTIEPHGAYSQVSITSPVAVQAISGPIHGKRRADKLCDVFISIKYDGKQLWFDELVIFDRQ